MGDTGNGCYPPLYFDKTFNLSSSAMPAQEYGFPPEPETCAESCRIVEGCKYFVHDGSDNRCWLNRVPTSGKFGCGMKDYKAYVLTGVAREPCGPVNMVRAWSACLMCDRFVPRRTMAPTAAAAQRAWPWSVDLLPRGVSIRMLATNTCTHTLPLAALAFDGPLGVA